MRNYVLCYKHNICVKQLHIVNVHHNDTKDIDFALTD